MNLPSLPLVVLDTETTGFVPRVHKVIEFASMGCSDGKMVSSYDQLFASADVPPVVQVLTRITPKDLQGQPTIADKREEILKQIPEGTIVVGQNTPFDIGMLKGEGIDLSTRPWIDTSMLASLVFPELESYSLGYLSTVLKLNHTPKHRALGDVRATLELLVKCWERLTELPATRIDEAKEIMAKAPEGYRRLFEAIPTSKAKKVPGWLKKIEEYGTGNDAKAWALEGDEKLQVLPEPLDAGTINGIIAGALKGKTSTVIAVKNMDATLRRLPKALLEDKDLRVVFSPYQLLDAEAQKRFLAQDAFTNDEATLAVKLRWYAPRIRREFPLHGGEEQVWNGKLACTGLSPTYHDQFKNLPKALLIDHRHFLEILEDPEHSAHKSLGKDVRVVMDDASMLEDTATKAFGWNVAIEDLRAASQGNPLLAKLLDTLQVWIERVRAFQDVRYFTPGDLTGPDAKGVRSLLEQVEKEAGFPTQITQKLSALRSVMDPLLLPHRIAWIEQRREGNQYLSSVPERIGLSLKEYLYDHFSTTLLVPPHLSGNVPEIIPDSKNHSATTSYKLPVTSFSISFPRDTSLEDLFANPPKGKTVILLPGRSSIEDLYVKYQIPLEQRGITLVCQGISGGVGRMQAEFHAAEGDALWLMTPWTFEGIDLPEPCLDHLILKTLPFDHPSHPVLSRRSMHFRDPFNEYSLPRLLCRLFRIFRTYVRLKKPDGDVLCMDERIFTKKYGKTVQEYVMQFASEAQGTEPSAVAPQKKPKKSGEGQMTMF